MNDAVRLGEHANGFDHIDIGNPGSLSNPFEKMSCPLPYGSWCKCSKCGCLGRSTYTFDFYGGEGDLLVCETCKQGGS